jgi:hypothetical protein
MNNLITIRITTSTDTMVYFFELDTCYGTRNKPYKADNFCSVSAKGAKTTGIHNVFMLEADTEYQFQLIDDSSDSDIYIINDTAAFALSIIGSDTPLESDWAKIMDLDYNKPWIDVTGDLIYNLSNDQEKNLFKMKTQSADHFEQNHNLQYSMIFQVSVNGKIKIARIDPLIANTSDDRR